MSNDILGNEPSQLLSASARPIHHLGVGYFEGIVYEAQAAADL